MKLLVVDDDENTLDYIKNAFELAWPEARVITAKLGDEAIKVAHNDLPDVVLLDLGLPDVSGFDVVRSIRSHSNAPIMIITVRSEEHNIVKALSLGADEYLVKPFGQLELVARARALLRRCVDKEQETVMAYKSLLLNLATNELSYKQQCVVALTQIEKCIVYELMKAQGKTVSNHSIAEQLYGPNPSEYSATIKTYIYRIRRKIDEGLDKSLRLVCRTGVGYYLLVD